jgi:orotate phosphoribosyltransferase
MLEETRKAAGIVKLMERSGALMSGHFELASGLHSDKYIQCALLLQDPERAQRVGQELAALLRGSLGGMVASVVVSPALGGVVIGHEVARALGCRDIFTERVAGKMTLRRGFEIAGGEKVVVVEDVTTTGGSIREVVEVVQAHGGELAAVGLIVNRAGSLDFGAPLVYLVKAEIENHKPETCPLCKNGVPVVKPGTKRNQMGSRS